MIKRKFFFLIYVLLTVQYIHIIAGNIALVSIPKAGTHLLLEAVRLITGNFQPELFPQGWCIIDDLCMGFFLQKDLILRAHAIHCERNIKILSDKQIRIFFIYRDPRDQIISAAFFIKKKLGRSLDFNVLIDELIINITIIFWLY